MYDSSNFLFYVVFAQYSAQQILKKKSIISMQNGVLTRIMSLRWIRTRFQSVKLKHNFFAYRYA